MYLDGDGHPVPGSSLIGPLAAGVPGTPAGMWELHQRYGRLPWSQVVQPAIRLAEDGFMVTERLSTAIDEARDLLGRFPETAAVWLPEGKVPPAGSTMVLPQLAATLRAYANDGPAAITSGPAAAAIEAVSQRHGGVLSAADLAAYRVVWRTPVLFNAFGWKVASMPLPSSGGIILGETCGMLERLGWSDLPRLGADRAHLLVEVWRRAYADRFVLGDPQTTLADRSDLLDPGWLDRRARTISMTTASSSREVRPWPDRAPGEREQTTHLSVLDRNGNGVSMTTTLNGAFGCGLLVPGLGFLLNNEMDDFATVAGRPNQFGLVQGEANIVGPGRRMLSSMAPTIAWSEDETLALGSPGGSRIPTATAQVMLALIVDHLELQAAVDQPRIHHQWLPDRIEAEPDALSPETEGELRRRRHTIEDRPSMGCVNAVRLAGTVLEAAADPRGPGDAEVVSPAPGTWP
jgi:gamma-glutamyltranspeptidase/glutathione hydrolase